MTAGPGDTLESSTKRQRKNSKETIHSGHFMVSDFEAEEQDDEGVEVPDPTESEVAVEEIQGVRGINQGGVITYAKPTTSNKMDGTSIMIDASLTVSIDASLTKLFQTMSLAYRQNITSPKWNCFKGLRLRWKDKIRLNNVIWRCWHMQYIQKKKMNVCQFALDVDIHNRPEAVVLEGKYWKRRLKAVTAEYKKWRLFYKNSLSGVDSMIDQPDMSFLGLEEMDWAGSFFNKQGTSLDGSLSDCFDLTDMLFSPYITSPQPFPFPNPREIARGTGNSDLLQPGLIQLQPDLADDDMMDIHEMLAGRCLPTVPEEDFFPDVGATASLPPSTSPPSVSTPTPTAHTHYSPTRLTISTPCYPTSTSSPSYPTTTTSPLFHDTSDTFIPVSHSHSPPTPPSTTTHTHTHLSPTTHTHLSPPHIQPPHAEFKLSLRQENPPRPLTRSRSAQDLQPRSDPRDIPHQEAGAPMGVGRSFAVPKAVPKKKYYVSPPSFGGPQVTTSADSIAFPSVVTLSTHRLPAAAAEPSLPPQIPRPSHHHHHHHHHHPTPSQPKLNTPELQHGAPFCPTPDSALLAHLFTPDNYSSPSNQPPMPGPPQSPHHTNKIKVPRITPRPYPDIAITSGSNTSNRSSSSSSNNSLILNNQSSSSLSRVVNPPPPASHHQPHLLPNITLSAVTPSSIKSIQTNPSGQVSNWSSGCAALSLQGSPPYPESKSPPNSLHSANSPPNKPFRPKNDVERVQYKEHRRVCHINAEQKRRCNIKNNFEMLHSLIPAVNQNPNAKVSKATMLHKGAEYIMQMKQERQQYAEQAEQLRNKIETLSSEISQAQSLLPATGAPMSHTRHNKVRDMFEAYVQDRTLSNPKHFVLALVAQPLLETFNSSVSTASVDDLCRSSMAWLDQHCSLNVLRPVVSNAMRKLSTTTNILTTPDTLCQDIFRQVTKREGAKMGAGAGGSSSSSFKSEQAAASSKSSSSSLR